MLYNRVHAERFFRVGRTVHDQNDPGTLAALKGVIETLANRLTPFF